MSEFFRSGRIHRINVGGLESFCLIASNILSTRTWAGLHLNWEFSWITADGGSRSYKHHSNSYFSCYIYHHNRCIILYVSELTSPLAWEHLGRSLRRVFMSQHEEKLTIAQCVILVGSTNVWNHIYIFKC